jgi:hypothetical protein
LFVNLGSVQATKRSAIIPPGQTGPIYLFFNFFFETSREVIVWRNEIFEVRKDRHDMSHQ